MEDLHYRIPPDILHYEPRLIFGLSATELMIGAMIGMAVMLLVGPIAGLIVGALSLLALRRFDNLGNRSVVVWIVMMQIYKYWPRSVRIPRTLPPQGSSLLVESWSGETLYTMEQEQ